MHLFLHRTLFYFFTKEKRKNSWATGWNVYGKQNLITQKKNTLSCLIFYNQWVKENPHNPKNEYFIHVYGGKRGVVFKLWVMDWFLGGLRTFARYRLTDKKQVQPSH